MALAASAHSRFSNRPFEVKRFQTIHHDVSMSPHGLVLLYGIGTKALPSWDSKTRWSDLMGGLTVRLTVGPSGCANSPHPSSREGHQSTARMGLRTGAPMPRTGDRGITGSARQFGYSSTGALSFFAGLQKREGSHLRLPCSPISPDDQL
jgi:hypothetical protein